MLYCSFVEPVACNFGTTCSSLACLGCFLLWEPVLTDSAHGF